MILLYVNGEKCDVGNDNINLNKEFETTDELEILEASYSYSFTLPFTLTNKRIFGWSESFDVGGKFDRIYKAQLYSNETLILDGNLLLNEINEDGYDVNIYKPQQVSVKDILGDLQLNEIAPHMKGINKYDDINTINDYVLNYSYGANLPSSTDAYLKLQYDNHICFPYALYSYPYNKVDSSKVTDEKHQQYLGFEDNAFDMNNIFPAFNVLSVLKDIFKTKDLKLQGNIFSNKIFTDLYQTFGRIDYKQYLEKKNSAYYLEYQCGYNMVKGGRISNTLVMTNIFQSELCGFDAPLLSDNSDIIILSNDYDMMRKGTSGYTVTVPKSGWYQISFNGMFSYVQRPHSFYMAQDGRTSVVGLLSSRGNGTLRHCPFEFQVKKGRALGNTQMYGLITSVPSVPIDYSSGQTVFCEEVAKNVAATYVRFVDRLPQNNKTMVLKNYSGYDISDFICGARFGRSNNGYNQTVKFKGGQDKNYGDNVLDGHTAHCCLPKDGCEIKGGELIKMYEYDVSTYNGEQTATTYCYDYNSAQAMVTQDSYSNVDAYLNARKEGDRLRTTLDPSSAISYVGQRNNTASVNGGSQSGGYCDVSTCVWLEEGELINTEILVPAYWTADTWKGWDKKWEKGVVDTNLRYTFSMGYINDDKEWSPNDEEPIPDIWKMRENRTTNVNELLPEDSANDYLENFLKTFNLKIKKVSEDTYSIDYSNIYTANGKVLKLDEYAHHQDAKYSRLDIPSTISMKFTIDKKEQGFNDDRKDWKTDNKLFFVPQYYDGSRIYSNPSNTTEDELKYESKYSYNWFTEINCIDKNNNRKTVYAPLIMKKDVYDLNDLRAVRKKGYATNLNSRLFYIKNDDTIGNSYIEFEYNEDNKKARLLLTSPYKTLGGMFSNKRFYLDYNSFNKPYTNHYSNIQTKYYNNINTNTNYQIDIDMILPNHTFSEINSSSYVSFNDGIYKMVGIDGHDTDEKNPSTISFKTL